MSSGRPSSSGISLSASTSRGVVQSSRLQVSVYPRLSLPCADSQPTMLGGKTTKGNICSKRQSLPEEISSFISESSSGRGGEVASMRVPWEGSHMLQHIVGMSNSPTSPLVPFLGTRLGTACVWHVHCGSYWLTPGGWLAQGLHMVLGQCVLNGSSRARLPRCGMS